MGVVGGEIQRDGDPKEKWFCLVAKALAWDTGDLGSPTGLLDAFGQVVSPTVKRGNDTLKSTSRSTNEKS